MAISRLNSGTHWSSPRNRPATVTRSRKFSPILAGCYSPISGSSVNISTASSNTQWTSSGSSVDTKSILGSPMESAGSAGTGGASTPHSCAIATGSLYAVVMAAPRRARVRDVHELAVSMPHVTVEHGPLGNPVYQVGGKSFVFFRNPRPDAVDPGTGERYLDVIVLWVPSESDKQALVQDQTSPFFTTPHFDGHPSVLVRASRIGELTLAELTEIVQDAWLCQASPRRAATWLGSEERRVGKECRSRWSPY